MRILSIFGGKPAISGRSVLIIRNIMLNQKGGLALNSKIIMFICIFFALTLIPVFSTHYEIEIISGEVFIAVWDGAVDITVDIGGGGDEVSLGEAEDYSYAKIDESGEVTELLAPPENFKEGHSSDPVSDMEDEDYPEPEQEDSDGSDDRSGPNLNDAIYGDDQSDGSSDDSAPEYGMTDDPGPEPADSDSEWGEEDYLEEEPFAEDPAEEPEPLSSGMNNRY